LLTTLGSGEIVWKYIAPKAQTSTSNAVTQC
jgi:hypothetical protein